MFVSFINVFTRVGKACFQGVYAILITKSATLKLKSSHLSFQNKITIFQRDVLAKTFCHFPSRRMTTNPFSEKTTAEHKVEEYKNTLQDYWRSFKPDLYVYRNKNHASHSL